MFAVPLFYNEPEDVVPDDHVVEHLVQLQGEAPGEFKAQTGSLAPKVCPLASALGS